MTKQQALSEYIAALHALNEAKRRAEEARKRAGHPEWDD